ncbi:acetyl-CoA hydrolase/transferase family protein [Acrocarpospora catenulata]|uniref:acetyl-CoA hydrolase/transferase family protein n=1 Tax=Acrocarpospora catenulata TaxID=2836182 RepID=UPI001BDB4E01|nr:acetyl-CoA hydrolase/transferase C-terminal domain-containing protein [Acrocarpospora catenulata]
MILTDRDDVFHGTPARARVVVGNACGTPLTLLAALADHAERAGGVTLTAGLLFGDPPLEAAIRSGGLSLRSWHVHGALRSLHREGLIDYLPLRLLDVPDTVLRGADIALIRVGPPDADGYCSLGPSTSFAAEAAEHAALVIAEVSPDVPRTRGSSSVHVSRIDRFVRSETPMAEYAPAQPDPVSRTVARNVVELLPEGATVQLGIGSVTEGLAEELAPIAAARSLGLLGLVTTPMIPLVEAVTASGRGPVRAVELMGGPPFMAWADDNAMIEMCSSQQLHHPAVLAGVPTLVSVNSAVAVDLRGQVVSESVGGAVIAGVGGSADFSEGAHLSPGGLRVIALRSTTRNGVSTIVPAHQPADAVTAPHHSVDAVVTEHGVAWLRGRTSRERRRELIAVAAPEHREALEGAS